MERYSFLFNELKDRDLVSFDEMKNRHVESKRTAVTNLVMLQTHNTLDSSTLPLEGLPKSRKPAAPKYNSSVTLDTPKTTLGILLSWHARAYYMNEVGMFSLLRKKRTNNLVVQQGFSF